MFLATRIVNGLVAVLMIFAIKEMIFYGFSSDAGVPIMLVCLYVLDLILRRKRGRWDGIFATVWTLLFAFPVYRSLPMFFFHPNIPEGLSDPTLFLYGTSVVVSIPFFLNGIYLLRMLFKKEKPPQTS